MAATTAATAIGMDTGTATAIGMDTGTATLTASTEVATANATDADAGC
jgi:hypothetical protein